MNTANAHLDRAQKALSDAKVAAQRIEKLMTLHYDADGAPAIMRIAGARYNLSDALRRACDACGDVGVELNDARWVGVVALLHKASTMVSDLTPHGARITGKLLDHMRANLDRLRNAKAGIIPKIIM